MEAKWTLHGISMGIIDFYQRKLFQDLKMEVLNHIWGANPLYIGLTYGEYLQFWIPEMAVDFIGFEWNVYRIQWDLKQPKLFF